MSNELAELDWPQVIDKAEERFVQVMPKSMKFEAEKSFAVQILSGNDYLMGIAKNNKRSLLSAVMNVAAVGLSLNPAKKQAYLIPRKGIVCFDVSYMGMCDLATMSGSIKWIQARCVYANDAEFIDNGMGEKPTHKYDARLSESQRGEFQLAYCVAKTEDGDYLTTIMSAEKVADIKGRSELGKKNQGPWVTDFIEQAKKSVVRNAFKMWPKTESMDRLALAIDISNENEGFEPILTSPNINEYSADQKKYFDQLIESNDHVGMFFLSQTHEETGVWSSLYNSFEKGSITKYKQIVSGLHSKGAAQVYDCVNALNSAAEAQDDTGVLEIVIDASEDEINHYYEKCLPETGEFIREVLRDNATPTGN